MLQRELPPLIGEDDSFLEAVERASQAAAAGEGASVVVANHTVTISFARGKSGAGDPAANAALYALEIKNKAASMATEENGARRAPEPEKLREMVTYDDI